MTTENLELISLSDEKRKALQGHLKRFRKTILSEMLVSFPISGKLDNLTRRKKLDNLVLGHAMVKRHDSPKKITPITLTELQAIAPYGSTAREDMDRIFRDHVTNNGRPTPIKTQEAYQLDVARLNSELRTPLLSTVKNKIKLQEGETNGQAFLDLLPENAKWNASQRIAIAALISHTRNIITSEASLQHQGPVYKTLQEELDGDDAIEGMINYVSLRPVVDVMTTAINTSIEQNVPIFEGETCMFTAAFAAILERQLRQEDGLDVTVTQGEKVEATRNPAHAIAEENATIKAVYKEYVKKAAEAAAEDAERNAMDIANKTLEKILALKIFELRGAAEKVKESADKISVIKNQFSSDDGLIAELEKAIAESKQTIATASAELEQATAQAENINQSAVSDEGSPNKQAAAPEQQGFFLLNWLIQVIAYLFNYILAERGQTTENTTQASVLTSASTSAPAEIELPATNATPSVKQEETVKEEVGDTKQIETVVERSDIVPPQTDTTATAPVTTQPPAAQPATMAHAVGASLFGNGAARKASQANALLTAADDDVLEEADEAEQGPTSVAGKLPELVSSTESKESVSKPKEILVGGKSLGQ